MGNVKQERNKVMAFFDKIGETLAAKGKDVADKAREMAEVNRLNGQINSQKSMAEKIYTEIGRMVCENRENWRNMDVSEPLERLDSIQTEIVRLQEEILRVKGVCRCGSCGAEIDGNVTFCPKCGFAMDVSGEEPEAGQSQESQQGQENRSEGPEAVICSGCHKEIEPGMMFCPFCGMKL